jgi:hypothetical protein
MTRCVANMPVAYALPAVSSPSRLGRSAPCFDGVHRAGNFAAGANASGCISVLAVLNSEKRDGHRDFEGRDWLVFDLD